jgi:hypothetical protein
MNGSFFVSLQGEAAFNMFITNPRENAFKAKLGNEG